MKSAQMAILGILFVVLGAAGACAAEPVRSKALDPRLRDLPVIATYTIGRAEALTNAKWPFTADEVVIACAHPAINVVGVRGTYAALNGTASSYAARHDSTTRRQARYIVEQSDGRTVPFVSTSDNQNFKDAGTVVRNAENPDIGAWWDVLNRKLLTVCE